MFFLGVHGDFSKTYHILGHRTILNRYRKAEITSYILFYHNGLRLQINSKRNPRTYTNSWKLSNELLNSEWVLSLEKSRQKKFTILESNENYSTPYQNL